MGANIEILIHFHTLTTSSKSCVTSVIILMLAPICFMNDEVLQRVKHALKSYSFLVKIVFYTKF